MTIPFFKSLEDAQKFLDYLYSLPIYRLAKHYRQDNVVKVADEFWQRAK